VSPFSTCFHDLRRRHGVSQKDLANKIDCKQVYISQIECGKKPPSAEFISKLIAGLNLDAVEQVALRQSAEDSQRKYVLPSNASAEVSRMVSKLWREIENLNPSQIRIITETLQVRD